MRARFMLCAACAAVLGMTASSAYGQYGPQGLPGYPAAMAGPAFSGPYLSPGVLQPAPTAISAKPAFRVKLANADGSSEQTLAVPQPIDPTLGDEASMDKFYGDDSGKGKGKGKDDCGPVYNSRVYAEYLYLRPRDAEVTYGVESNLNLPSQDVAPVQTSPIGMVDPDYSSGFRFGFALCLDDCSEIAATYTMFESDTTDSIVRDLTNNQLAIFPMTIHPATENAVATTVEAEGNYGVDFDLLDIDYRRVLRRGPQSDLTGIVGVRYGQLEQNFFARYSDELAQEANDTEVLTDVDFEGIGLRLGLDFEQYSCRHPVLIYAKGSTALLAGEFDAAYQQTVQNNSYPGVDTEWTAGRLVPTFDLEVGAGFYLPGGSLRATAGYAYSVWTNVVKTEDWIHGVQQNRFNDMGDAITFDGFVLRVEGRF